MSALVLIGLCGPGSPGDGASGETSGNTSMGTMSESVDWPMMERVHGEGPAAGPIVSGSESLAEARVERQGRGPPRHADALQASVVRIRR